MREWRELLWIGIEATRRYGTVCLFPLIWLFSVSLYMYLIILNTQLKGWPSTTINSSCFVNTMKYVKWNVGTAIWLCCHTYLVYFITVIYIYVDTHTMYMFIPDEIKYLLTYLLTIHHGINITCINHNYMALINI